jgi:hypothetical protein
VIQNNPIPSVVETQEKMIGGLLDWLNAQNLIPSMSNEELRLLAHDPGRWGPQDLHSAGWHTEALGTLLWALSCIDPLPEYDQPFDRQETFDLVGLMRPVDDFIYGTELRTEGILKMERDRAELWNWRAHVTVMDARGVRPPQEYTYAQVIQMTTEAALQAGTLQKATDGDFPAFGKPYREIAPDEFEKLSALARERFGALSWILGNAPDWDAAAAEMS